MITETEKSKYTQIWQSGAYDGARTPGLEHVPLFWRIANPQHRQSVIDVGAGSGDACAEFQRRGLRAVGFDITDAGWKQGDDIRLITGSIWNDLPVKAHFDFAYCCDVMEHIPESLVGLSIERIRMAAARCFFSIHFGPDIHGAQIGAPLHLTVKPFVWWRDLFRELGHLADARDLLGHGVFFVA